MLLGICQEIAKDPEVGKRYDEIIPGLLGMKAGRHVIFYRRSSTDLVLIIRILHEQMDLRTRLIE
jgi:toxin ParE1/3/4